MGAFFFFQSCVFKKKRFWEWLSRSMHESGSLCCLILHDCKQISCCDALSVFSYTDGLCCWIYTKAKAISSLQQTLRWLELHEGHWAAVPKLQVVQGAPHRSRHTTFLTGGGFPKRNGKSQQGTLTLVLSLWKCVNRVKNWEMCTDDVMKVKLQSLPWCDDTKSCDAKKMLLYAIRVPFGNLYGYDCINLRKLCY